MSGAAAARRLREADPLVASVAASLLVHLLLVVAVALWPRRGMPPPIEEALPVEIVTSIPEPSAPMIAPMTAPASSAPPVAEARSPPTAPPAPVPPATPSAGSAAPEIVRPTHMLASAVLSDPRSRSVREGLARMTGEERMVQLCGLEAMAQIHAWRKSLEPDRLVSYAMAALKREGAALVADGAAFRSRGEWYALTLRCEPSGDRQTVAGVSFAVGTPIPHAEWEAHGLYPQ